MKSTNAQAGLASIIIPCWNQLEFTRHCIAALVRHTREPWELIVVNNGSTDGTADYLAGVQDTSRVPVSVISNVSNRGFPAAINQGLQVARGEYLVLLNNDVVVTDAWLDQLAALADAQRIESPIGLVGPMSNYAAPPQLVEGVPYSDLAEMHRFARRWRDEHRSQWFTVPKVSGFCLLMKRAVYDAICWLDERFGIGFFDDDDLAERARRGGYALAVANDLFVHHFGSRTFVCNGIDAEALLEENARRFADKWGGGAPHGRRVVLQPWSGGEPSHSKTENGISRKAAKHAKKTPNAEPNPSSSDSFAPLRHCVRSSVSDPGQAKVSLTMIVRNEESNLRPCLESARGLFDETVVVDTGSTDRTGEIALEFGAKVFDFVWVDNFAAARNEALAHATGDYAFWLDADDLLDPPQREKLRGDGNRDAISIDVDPPFW